MRTWQVQIEVTLSPIFKVLDKKSILIPYFMCHEYRVNLSMISQPCDIEPISISYAVGVLVVRKQFVAAALLLTVYLGLSLWVLCGFFRRKPKQIPSKQTPVGFAESLRAML